MDKKFLSYFQADKADDKQSLYDMSHHNLFSATFGGLTCTFWDKVLAKDYYKIAASTQSKGAALSSPTFTELKSNDYAFFVPNQIIWKHWNDYFTNGTEFADTYGSNRNNQDLQGLFKEPHIPVNYLQLIGKIAKGYAAPAYRYSMQSVINYIDNISYENYGVQNYKFCSPLDLKTIYNIDIFRILIYYHPELIEGLKGITIDPVSTTQISGSGMSNGFYQFDLSQLDEYGYFYVFGSPSDIRNFEHVFFGTDIEVDESQINFTNNYLAYTDETQEMDFVCLSDNSSSRPRFSDSPWLLESYQEPHLLFNNKVTLTNIRYKKRLGITDEKLFEYRKLWDHDLLSSQYYTAKNIRFITVRDNCFFYKSAFYCDEFNIVNLSLYSQPGGVVFGENGNIIIQTSNLSDINLDIFLHEDFPVSVQDGVFLSGAEHWDIFDTTISTNNLCDSPFDEYEPQIFFENSSNLKFYYPSLLKTFQDKECWVTQFSGSRYVFNLVTLYHYTYQNSGYSTDMNPFIYDPQANVLGYTQFAFFIYLYQNVCKHLDYTGLPLDTFVPRPFKPYARETVSALPYFAYSKIWNEYFRNRTVSSPELDFSETNGNIFQGRNYVKYYNNYPSPASPDEAIEGFNSWVIPFCCTPKSGIDEDLRFLGGTSFANFKNELHYYNLNNLTSVFALLTGYQLSMHVLNQLANPYINESFSNTNYVLGFIYDHFVLPSYYNGLLHYKYQNFTKDYFSSALLDPMSGANQENIPTTVTELRTAQAKQSFWERTAVARSIKKFYEMMVGTTPTHIEYDKPLLLGADHQNVQVSEVIQTSETDTTPLGTRAGIIADFGKGGLASHFFNEPGIIMVLHSITVDAQYMQGLLKKFTPYESYLDYPFTQFAHIGNESIFMRELNFTSNSDRSSNLSGSSLYKVLDVEDDFGQKGIPRSSVVNNPMYVKLNNIFFPETHANMVEATNDRMDAVFGYIPRFSSYKFAFDEVHGDFRESMDYWHTFREFHYMPYLSHEFVNYESALRDSNLERIFAVLEDGDKFWQSVHFYITVKRSIPYYTVPKNYVN